MDLSLLQKITNASAKIDGCTEMADTTYGGIQHMQTRSKWHYTSFSIISPPTINLHLFSVPRYAGLELQMFKAYEIVLKAP